MRITQRQLQQLTRHPRSTKVWSQLGVKLDASTRVVVQGNQVMIVRQPTNMTVQL